jgi:hypothetical protein
MNSSSHATIDDKNLELLLFVLYLWRKLEVNSSIKCIDCGMSEEKKLASDFGKDALLRLENVNQNRS